MQRGNHGSRLYAWLTLLAILFASRSSFAIPEAHILRIDPRAGVAGGTPLLTTVVEVVETRSMSDVVTSAGCGQATGDAMLDCISNAVEAKNAMFKPFQFPDSGANLMIRVDGTENLAKMESKGTWGSMAKDPLVGTAWLIGLDASSNMGARYADAREVANQMISALGPNDVAKLIIFDDRVQPFVAASPWLPAAQKATLIGLLASNPGTSPSHGRDRPLFNTIKNITKAFGELGNVGTTFTIPMHQTMVLLSNGSGRADASNSAVSAEGLKQFFNKGRFPEDNVLAPKTPLPVISIYFPNARGFVNDQFATNDMQFMQDLSNPEIGGFFDIVRTNQGVTKATAILGAVKNRFNQMWVVKWRLSCLASTAEQTFNLVFSGQGAQAVKPDGSFREVPIGVDPTSWPLDIDMALTKAEADANPVHPGGTIKIFGNFCWAGDKNRAEAYFVPAGTNPNQNVNRNDPAIARKAMQQIQAQGLHGTADECSATHVVIKIPDEEKLLEGEGDNAIARLVLYDNKAQRASGVTPETVLTLKAGKKPFNYPIILGAAGIVVVILLLVVVLLRGGGGGGGGRKKGGAPPPQPIVAGGMPGPPPGYGAPPGGGYGGGAPPYGGGGGPPHGGGGYGAAPLDPAPPPMQAMVPVMAPVLAAPPPIQPLPPPPLGGGGYPLAVAGGAPVEVRCPACSMATLVVPGQAGVCFSCGQPLPRDIASSGAAAAPAAAPAFPLTSAIAAQPLAPPPNPYGQTPTSATIVGAVGSFAIAGGIEVRIGRDPAACAITLQEPRVSGIHATLKFEAGQLFVRDEGSNNGTHVAGSRIPAATWTSVPQGAQLRFGPVEFTVRFEG